MNFSDTTKNLPLRKIKCERCGKDVEYRYGMKFYIDKDGRYIASMDGACDKNAVYGGGAGIPCACGWWN